MINHKAIGINKSDGFLKTLVSNDWTNTIFAHDKAD